MIVKSQMKRLGVLFTILILSGAGLGSTQKSTPPGRLRVAILGFANETGDSELSHWSYGFERLLSGELKQIKAIKLSDGVDYAHRQLDINKNTSIKPEQARKMGELIEAQRVVWGSYRKQNNQWQFRIQILNVASGKAGNELEVACTDWFELRDRLTEQILHELGIKPSEQERQKMGRQWTTSPDALEWYSRSCAYGEENKPFSEQEECARNAIAADPQFARAYLALSATAGMQGKFTQAEQAVQQALKLSPEFAGAHRLAGVTSLFMGNNEEGERQLRKANRLDPDDSRVLVRLAELSFLQRKWDEAIAFAENARNIEPIDASVHALLGFLYTFKGHRDEVMVELKDAQRLDPEGIEVLQRVGQAYERMHEIPLAVEYYERFVSQIKELGGDPRAISVLENITDKLQASLIPTFIEAKIPNVYTEQSLHEVLRERLTEDELKMVVNPIVSNAEMKHWAEQLSEGAATDLDKAKALFDALAGRIQTGGGCGHRTAKEAFAAWNDTDVSFICTEYANLFVALARVVGLKAFYVHVEKDYRGKLVNHDCAVVFVDDKVLLVDTSYRWFGVPHKKFVILDDLQTIAHHVVQLNDTDRKVALRRIAVKLHPGFAWVQFALIKSLCEAEQWDEAHVIFESVLQLEPQASEVCFWRGVFAIHDNDLDTATNYLQKALELNPESALGHFNLGNLLGRQGKLNKAREEFRTCLRYDPEPEIAGQAHHIIAQINEIIGLEHSESETNERENDVVEIDN